MTGTSTNQVWDPERYARTAAFVPEFGREVVELLAPQPGERILDLGCGDGVLMQALVDAGAEVVGVDASPDMVAAACARGFDARVADGQQLPFEAEFDAVFSNAALHWMGNLPAAIGSVRRALKPGGRFVAEMGGEGNVASVVAAIEWVFEKRKLDVLRLNPWVFPNFDGMHHLLHQRAFHVVHLDCFERQIELPGDITDWLGTFAGTFLAAIPEDERPAVLAEIREELTDSQLREDGTWWIDYVRLRFAAIRMD
ncbi:MAG: methyltransferase domain-containing protein [Defluviicoccus sp.]|nr:MAG: methyltransferase domain-containing protein [Defluviicoccus sp.]